MSCLTLWNSDRLVASISASLALGKIGAEKLRDITIGLSGQIVCHGACDRASILFALVDDVVEKHLRQPLQLLLLRFLASDRQVLLAEARQPLDLGLDGAQQVVGFFGRGRQLLFEQL